MKKSLIYIWIITTLVFTGCVSKYGNQKLGNMEEQKIEALIIKGKTTKNDVVAYFGGPQDVDMTSSGLDKWKYVYYTQKFNTNSHIPILAIVKGGSQDERKLLFLIFKDNIVINYSLSTTTEETKFGIGSMLD